MAVGLAIVFCSFKFIYPCGQLFELLNELRQAQRGGNYTPCLFVVNRRRPKYLPTGRNVTDYGAPGANHSAIANLDIVNDAGLAGKNNTVANLRTAGYADLPYYQAAFADDDVMGYLNEVIDFCARTDSGFAEFGPVNAAISTNLDEVLYNDDAVVRDEPMCAIDEVIAKAGGADCGVGLNDDVIADDTAMVNDNVWVKPAVSADFCLLAYFAAGGDNRIIAYLGAVLNNYTWANRGIFPEFGLLAKCRRGVNAGGRWLELRREYLERLNKGRVDIFDHKLGH
jgi:hypothetical protein